MHFDIFCHSKDCSCLWFENKTTMSRPCFYTLSDKGFALRIWVLLHLDWTLLQNSRTLCWLTGRCHTLLVPPQLEGNWWWIQTSPLKPSSVSATHNHTNRPVHWSFSPLILHLASTMAGNREPDGQRDRHQHKLQQMQNYFTWKSKNEHMVCVVYTLHCMVSHTRSTVSTHPIFLDIIFRSLYLDLWRWIWFIIEHEKKSTTGSTIIPTFIHTY